MKLWIKNLQHLAKRKFNLTKSLLLHFKHTHPIRFLSIIHFAIFVFLTIGFRFFLNDILFAKFTDVSAKQQLESSIERANIETLLNEESQQNVKGIYTSPRDQKIRSDVGFVDLRVLTLEDFFASYDSKLSEYSDEFIEVCERYEIENWQLLPAIAMAETRGCQTGESFRQRNCWGWGGSEPNRWEFNTFEEAIDVIAYRMKNGYGNEYLNAKDIQSTYCGRTCMQWGWRWAKGVDYYTKKINDFGEGYGLSRTHEIEDWS